MLAADTGERVVEPALDPVPVDTDAITLRR
jgi:hypothetical protein